jgi:acyl-coenzyme A synthetase/AMP-(fatty) acid ligase
MFVNVYGPTEITCNCTYHIIDKNREYDKIPIGKPFPNERVILLDKNNNIIKDKNVNGELCVIGSSLALGYFNNMEQTNKYFVQNPNNNNYNELIYKTGDLAYYNNDDDLVFSGRVDFQIKYQGHRIELEEIEKTIMKFDNIDRACCIFEEEKSKLYGFYVGNIDKKELHSKLKEKLPVFMIPSKLIKVNYFPITKNGKIDRKELLLMKDDKHD